MNTRPTPDQLAEARATVGHWLEWCSDEAPVPRAAIRVLCAATEPPTDEDIADAYVENIIPRASERLAERRARMASEVAATIKEPVAAVWPPEVCAARVVRHFLGPVKP